MPSPRRRPRCHVPPLPIPAHTLSPEGVLYTGQTSHPDNARRLFALTKENGNAIWTKDLPPAIGTQDFWGFEDTLVFNDNATRTKILALADGKTTSEVDQGTLATIKGLGILVANFREFGASVFRKDGALTGWTAGVPFLVDAEGDLLLHSDSTGPEGSPQIQRYSCASGPVGQPITIPTAGTPSYLLTAVLGADGTIYFLTLDRSPGPTAKFELIAVDPGFNVLWRLNFVDRAVAMGTSSPIGVVLADDGVLHFVVSKFPGTTGELIAVQTRSPGLARTPMPGRYHDNRGTGWTPP